MPEQLREQLVGAAAHNGSLQQTSVNWRVRSVWMLAHCVSMFESAAELIELSLQIETSGPLKIQGGCRMSPLKSISGQNHTSRGDAMG